MASVLVIDDEADILRLVEAVLVRDGHDVVTASSGERAIEQFRKHDKPFDLLVTDVVMPGLSGPMVVDQLRGQFPKLKVLFMSAFDDHQIVRRYVKDAGYALLPKPFHIDQLSAKVRELLDRTVRRTGDGAEASA